MAKRRALLGLLLVASAHSVAADGAGFVSGLQPDRRPAGFAAVRAESIVPAQQLARGIEGFSAAQFAWFAHQGPWYTPFGSPGGTGPYDFRRLHATDKVAADKAATPPGAAGKAEAR